MLNNDTLIKVTNNDNGSVGFTIPDGKYDIREVFQRGETREIPFGVLKKLTYQPGGRVLLEHFLRIQDKEALARLLGTVEPEYFYSDEDIKKLLLFGSLDELKDCLDFAPEGVVSRVQDLAVRLEINDIQKREAILDLTGFDVTGAITINKETIEPEKEKKAVRRVGAEKVEEAPKGPVRRVPTIKSKDGE